MLLPDDEIGKFACVVCRKRFTRSDLLNRHRRIHTNPQSEGSTKQHVTKTEQTSVSPTHAEPPPFDQELHITARSLPQEVNGTLVHDHNNGISHQNVISQNGVSHQDGVSNSHSDPTVPVAVISNVHQNGVISNGHTTDVYHEQHQNLFIEHPTAGYQDYVSHHGLSQTPAMLPPPPDQSHGLTSLMEAALAPQESFNFTFTPAENIDPGLWGGFMLFGDNNPNAYMGTYNADISWSLNSFGTDNSPMYDMVKDMGDFPGDPYHYVPYQKIEVHPIDAADAEDEDTNDWPDKAGKSDGQVIPRRAPRIVPLHLIPVSWQPILDEARGTGFTSATIRPYQNFNEPLRASLLVALDGTQFGRTELSRPEIADAIFPPTDVLDFFLRSYIRYVHPRFPILHLPTFDIYNTPPLLLLAMMFLGSGHSRMDRGRFCRLFYDHLRIACFRLQEMDEKCVGLLHLTF